MRPPAQRNTIPLLGAEPQRRPRWAEAPKQFTAHPTFVAPRYENKAGAFNRNIQPMTWLQPIPLADFNAMHFRIGGAPASLTVNRSTARPHDGSSPKDVLYDKHSREMNGNHDHRRLWVTSTGEFFRN